ncbi:hypothetical protein Tco_1123173 [Tanacetum coccineum]|uniref:Uncharacterized protein n=1 Tax=Tanacetum coccineum TaxID=301880 RepID=A0ABQ5J2L9_9ASTR
MAESQCNKGDKVKVILVLGIRVMLLSLGETMQKDRQGLLNAITVKVKGIWLDNALSLSDQGMQHDPGVPDDHAVQTIILNNAAFQTEDFDTYNSNYYDISNAQAVLMANISNYGSDVISEVPHSETNLNDMENQDVQAMQDFEQTPAVDFTDNEIHSDSNIISYSQYLQETQQANEMANKEQNNESVTTELERYKERVKTFRQRLNIDLSSHEKMIDSQMDDMIREKLAPKEQVDSLEQNLSKQIKEKECLLQTFTVFKNESKEKEDKYMENKIDLEKKIKELDNILFKVGQSAQTVHMLTKPQAFYDNIHKQALGYQNPFYLRKAQRIKPTLYDGIVMSDKHVAMPVIDDEETLILEEKSRSKMSEKAKDPEIINKNISHKPIDYEKLNRLSEDFGKRFTPQQEMDAEQAFWLRISNPTSKPSDASPVKIEAPKELPKVSLVNESLKKLKFHLARFDNVVKIRTTPDACKENEDLKAQIQDKVFVITSLKNSLRKVKGKEIVDVAAKIPSSNTIVPVMFKLELELLAPRLILLLVMEAGCDVSDGTEDADFVKRLRSTYTLVLGKIIGKFDETKMEIKELKHNVGSKLGRWNSTKDEDSGRSP